MKQLLFSAAALTLLFASCKKSDSNNSGGGSASGTITINGTSYPQASTTGSSFSVSGNVISATGYNSSGVAGVVFEFPGGTAPAAGTYRVVSTDASLKAGQVSVTASNAGISGTANYGSTGTGSVDVTVSINSGKYTVVLPAAAVRQVDNGTATATVSANVSQQ